MAFTLKLTGQHGFFQHGLTCCMLKHDHVSTRWMWWARCYVVRLLRRRHDANYPCVMFSLKLMGGEPIKPCFSCKVSRPGLKCWSDSFKLPTGADCYGFAQFFGQSESGIFLLCCLDLHFFFVASVSLHQPNCKSLFAGENVLQYMFSWPEIHSCDILKKGASLSAGSLV